VYCSKDLHQRGSLMECEDVLDVELEVLERFKRNCEGADRTTVCFELLNTHPALGHPAHVVCFDRLYFNYGEIRYDRFRV
jgi:hypothetical protein